MVVGRFVVNIVLLAVDLLRGTQSNALLGVLGVVVIGVLVNTLLEEANPSRRNTALVLGGCLLLIGLVRLLSSPATGFDIWMQGWLVGPGAFTRCGCQVVPSLRGPPDECRLKPLSTVLREINATSPGFAPLEPILFSCTSSS